MDVEASRNTEIAARLERAIQSALASSSWSSSSTPSPSPSPSPSLPLEPESEPQRSPTSLSDLLLLLHLDMEDPISRICMAFSASPLHQEQPFLRRPPLSFTSSLAYRRLVESLHIDDLVCLSFHSYSCECFSEITYKTLFFFICGIHKKKPLSFIFKTCF